MKRANATPSLPPAARLIGVVLVLLLAAALGIPVMSGGGGGPTPAPIVRDDAREPNQPSDAARAPELVEPRRESRSAGDRTAPAAPPTRSTPVAPSTAATDPLADLRALINGQVSGEMVTATAQVHRILSDDDDGSRHQRFLIAVGRDGRRTLTVKVSHNIDLAPRVPLEEGDTVTIRGQFEFNDLGGVLHWTHHDPDRRREGGWIEHNGRRYE